MRRKNLEDEEITNVDTWGKSILGKRDKQRKDPKVRACLAY